MNVFRLCGDMLHLASIVLLIYKLRGSRSCSGISCRMQEMYLIVFGSRYLDILYNFISVYNTAMKIIFLLTTSYIIYLMRVQVPISETYDKANDRRFDYVKFVLPPVFVLSLLTTESVRQVTEILWTFSIWLEPLAILPQLFLLQKHRVVENLTAHYVVTMGLYRLMYIFNWIYRYYAEGFVNYIGWIAGAIQVALYLDFFYYYYLARITGSKMVLPYGNDV